MERVTWLDVPGIREGARVERRMREKVLDRWSWWEGVLQHCRINGGRPSELVRSRGDNCKEGGKSTSLYVCI